MYSARISTFRFKKSFFFIFLLTCSALLSAETEDDSLILRYTGSRELAVPPQTRITLSFFIENKTETEFTLAPVLQAPDKWQLITGMDPVHLEPGKSDIFLSTFYVPRGIAAGSYQLTFTVADEKDSEFVRTETIAVTVLPVQKISFKVLESPDYVIGGGTYTVNYLVSNDGNTPVIAFFDIKSTHKLPWQMRPGVYEDIGIALQNGQSLGFTISVDTTEYQAKYLSHRLEVAARIENGEKPQLLSTKVEVIPKQSSTPDIYFKYPLSVQLFNAVEYYNGWHDTLRLTAQGEGSLDEDKQYNLAFLLQKQIDEQNSLLVNPQDNYRVHFWTEDYEVVLGDQGFGLSPLLENYRFDRGIKAAFDIGNVQAGSYYHLSYLEDPIPHYIAGYAGVHFPSTNSAQNYNYQARINVFGEFQDSLLFSLYQKWNPISLVNIAADMAVGSSSDNAYRPAGYLQMNGSNTFLNYSISGLYADPLFPGVYQDQYAVSANINLHLLSNSITPAATFHQEGRNLLLDQEKPNAILQRSFKLSAGYSPGEDKLKLKGGWNISTSKDQLPNQAIDEIENQFDLKYTQPIGNLSIQTSALVGYKNETITGNTILRQKYSSLADYRPDADNRYALSLNYDGDINNLSVNPHTFGWEANIYHRSPKLQYNVGVQNDYNFRGIELASSRFGLHGNVLFFLNNNHILGIQLAGQLSILAEQWDSSFSLVLNYSMPFNIPITRKKSVGAVTGSIIDSSSGLPLADTIIRLGNQAYITDEFGQYTFAPLANGRYYLEADLSHLNGNFITVEKSPVEVTVTVGTEVTQDLHVIEGASLEGRVILYTFADSEQQRFVGEDEVPAESEAEYTEVRGLPYAVLELSGERGTTRRLSDDKGRFSFESILPGKYILHVSIAYLPEYHKIETDTFEFSFLSGQNEKADIRILPEWREIRIIEESDTLELKFDDK